MKKLNKKGFTIVELVIVIAVIAILAAVLIPTYSSVVDKANESSALQAVRNAYTQCQMATSGAGLTLKDGTVFSDKDGKYFFKLEGNTIKKTSDTPTDKTAYTELENGVRLYGRSIESKTNSTSSGVKVMNFKLGLNASTSITLTVYDSDGNQYYTETGSYKDWVCCCMYNKNNDAAATWGSANVSGVSEAAKNNLTAADAKGWYSYTLKIGTETYNGVFYYDGIE